MSAFFKPLSAFLTSSVGKKILVALTGAALVVFVLGHLIGNLLIFVSPDAINEYGHFLQTVGHGMGVWVARIGLLTCVLVHVILTIKLTKENNAARQERYGCDHTIQASKSSRFMIYSGLTILAFIVYHLMHFTLRIGNNYNSLKTVVHGESVHNVHRMVVEGFSWWPASVFYIFAMAMLCSHLSHGVSSMFQTLGLATAKTWPLFQKLGIAYALIIFIGNSSIPLAVLLGFVK